MALCLVAAPSTAVALQLVDFGGFARAVVAEFGFPAERVALGLEGGYDLREDEGMPAGLVRTCAALLDAPSAG